MTIPLRLDRSMGEVEQALEWWATLRNEEKVRWLQCEESAEEIDTMLHSPVLRVRDLARFGAVGDAWNEFREQTLAVLNFDDVIRAGGGEPPPNLPPRGRYEQYAEKWAGAGCPGDLLESYTLRVIAMRCWFNSSGFLQENKKKPLSNMFKDYFNASVKAQSDKRPRWYEEELRERTDCDRCGAAYMLENLAICTNCLSVYCYSCAMDYPKAENGNWAHDCGRNGNHGGELVG